MSEKIYVGKGKASKFGVNFSICLSDLPKEHIFEYNGKKYIKLSITEMRNEDQYGKTHTVSVDTWKPTPQGEGNGTRSETSDNSAAVEDVMGDVIDPDDLPF